MAHLPSERSGQDGMGTTGTQGSTDRTDDFLEGSRAAAAGRFPHGGHDFPAAAVRVPTPGEPAKALFERLSSLRFLALGRTLSLQVTAHKPHQAVGREQILGGCSG
jgi:hypothetical protein